MTKASYQHFVFTDRAEAEALVAEITSDAAADEAFEIIPDAAGARFVVAMYGAGEFVQYV